MAINQIESSAQAFIYNGLICFGDKVADYNTATLADIMDSMEGVGAIPDGTTEWSGEDASLENWTDEGGNVLDVTITAGSQGFNFQLASLSKTQVMRWLGAAKLTVADLGDNLAANAEVYGSADIPIQELPGLVINQTKDMAFLYPKMRVVAGLTYADKKFAISVSATALSVDSANLKTFMPLYGGVVMA